MRNVAPLIFLTLLLVSSARAQTAAVQPAAEQTIQPSQSSSSAARVEQSKTEIKIPAGTPLEVEVAYTVNSLDLKAGEHISFRVLVPIVVEGVTAIEEGALVTARITQAKRGGHWGRAGKLAWTMEDVVAADHSRIPLAPGTASRNDKLWSLESQPANSEPQQGAGRVTGTSHAGEVAAVSIATGVLFPPLALMGGFKRGENAILREGRRFVVVIGKDTTVKVVTAAATP